VNRRAFIGTLGLGFLAAPLAAGAQQPAGKVWRIGVLSPVPLTTLEAPSGPSLSKAQGRSSADDPGRCAVNLLLQWAFCQFGYVEGHNLKIEARWGAPDQLPALATELVRLKLDIIHAIGPVAIRAAKQATAAVPIVMMTSGDPVALGFVETLARPGGNVTGVSFLGEQLSGKLLELLKQAVPRGSRVAVLWNPANGAHAGYLREAQAAAQPLGVTLQPLEVRSPDDFDRVFGRITRERADAILSLLDPLFTANLRLIAEFAAKSRLPSLYGARELADAGGLMTYGPNLVELNRQMASYVDRILKGAKPADLPVEQPTKFELVINLKTAKALGLTIPPSLLQRADQVIE
jgi:putative ABC transport system substrate-binding protein